MIAYAVQRFPALRTTFIRREVEALRALGILLEVFSMRPVDRDEISDEKEALPHIDSTHYLPANPVDIESVIANLWASVRHPIRTLSCWSLALGDTGGRGLSKRLRLWLQLWRGSVLAKRLLKLGNCKHIHAQFSDGAATTALVASRILGIPFSFTSHTSYDSPLLRQKLLSAKFVASISEYDKRKLIEVGGMIIAERVHIIHCGIPIDDWPFRGVVPFHDPVRILSVGALIEKKGHDVLIEACSLLKNRGLQFNCKVIGAGPLKSQLESRIKENNLEACITLAGPLSQADIKKEISEADLFVLAAKTAANGDTDGIPVSLMEAMASGVPVVSANVAGIPELIVDKKMGCLAEEGESLPLRKCLEYFINNAGKNEEIVVAARNHIEEQFNQIIESRKLGSLIDRNEET